MTEVVLSVSSGGVGKATAFLGSVASRNNPTLTRISPTVSSTTSFMSSGGKVKGTTTVKGGKFEIPAGNYILAYGALQQFDNKTHTVGVQLITLNGTFIASDSKKYGRAGGGRLDVTVPDEKTIIDTFVPPPPTTEILEEDTLIFANVYRKFGSTLVGADPQQERLVSSGKISQSDLDILKANPDNRIEIIEEDQVQDINDVNTTPQNPFFIDAEGNKIYKVELVDSITIKDKN